MGFQTGDYVRFVIAPNTRMGTIEGSQIRRGFVEYHFRLDPRLDEPGPVFEAWIPEAELEYCARPSDEQVAAIKKLIKLGS